MKPLLICYQELANAVVRQAAEDYKFELNLLKIDPDLKSPRETLAELDRFFEGQQIDLYTELDGRFIRDGVKEMMNETEPKVDYCTLLELCRRIRLDIPPTNGDYERGYRDAVRRLERGIKRVAAKHRIRQRAVRDSEKTN